MSTTPHNDNCLLQHNIDALLSGELGKDERQALAAHLEAECDSCVEVLEAYDLDAEVLMLHALAQDEPGPAPAQLDRMWSAVTSKTRSRFQWRRPLFVGATMMAMAAAVLLWLTPADGPGPYDGVKGLASAPDAGIYLRDRQGQRVDELREGDVVELWHDATGAVELALFHWRRDAAPQLLFAGALPATGPSRLRNEAGILGYDFGDEPGVHLFVAFNSKQPMPLVELERHLDDGWFSSVPADVMKVAELDDVYVRVLRVVVTAEDAP